MRMDLILWRHCEAEPGEPDLGRRLTSKGLKQAERMAQWPAGTLFVVYCAGPHCNGADRAAFKLASLGLPVKIMIGGMTDWQDEGGPFASGKEPGVLHA